MKRKMKARTSTISDSTIHYIFIQGYKDDVQNFKILQLSTMEISALAAFMACTLFFVDKISKSFKVYLLLSNIHEFKAKVLNISKSFQKYS